MSTVFHCHVSVRGLILAENRELRRMMSTVLIDGRRPTTPAELRGALVVLLAQGVECLPVGKPCEGFSNKTGCPGHKKPEEP